MRILVNIQYHHVPCHQYSYNEVMFLYIIRLTVSLCRQKEINIIVCHVISSIYRQVWVWTRLGPLMVRVMGLGGTVVYKDSKDLQHVSWGWGHDGYNKVMCVRKRCP